MLISPQNRVQETERVRSSPNFKDESKEREQRLKTSPERISIPNGLGSAIMMPSEGNDNLYISDLDGKSMDNFLRKSNPNEMKDEMILGPQKQSRYSNLPFA